jgi:hypothetical protein
MTDAGASAGVVWWPRLVLWGTVIAVGTLYLLSVQQHRTEAGPQAAKQSSVLTAPAAGTQGTPAPEPVSTLVQLPVTSVTGAGAPTPASAGEVPRTHLNRPAARVQPTAQQPVPPVATLAAESLAEPRTEPRTELAATASGPASAAGSPRESPAPATNGGAARPAAVTSAPETQAPPAAVSRPAGASDVSPVEARAFAEAVTEAPSAGQTPPAAGPAPATGPEQTIWSPPAGTQSRPDQERARIVAEYEALRRAAERDLRPPGGWVQPGPQGYGPSHWPRGYYGPGANRAPGPGGGYAPTNPRWRSSAHR